jgi:hypothetical protein
MQFLAHPVENIPGIAAKLSVQVNDTGSEESLTSSTTQIKYF